MDCRKLFNKDIREISIIDIEKYFKEPKEESNVIEYKSFYSHKTNGGFKEKESTILKTICAFLNSEGGIIIWGAPIEEKDSDNNKYYAGELSPIDRLLRKDDFVSKYLTRIIPTPIKINCEVITYAEQDKCLLLLEVLESKIKPHQFNSRYYMRLDGQTRVAPHHYIEALFKQVKYPILEGKLEIRQLNRRIVDDYYLECEINLSIDNKSMYQNEINLSVSIVVDNTYQEVRDEFYKVCHYGKPIIKVSKIRLPLINRYSTQKAEVKILFGGERSPLKCSRYLYEYKIDQRFKNSTSTNIDSFCEMKKIKEELNKFIFELDSDFG